MTDLSSEQLIRQKLKVVFAYQITSCNIDFLKSYINIETMRTL